MLSSSIADYTASTEGCPPNLDNKDGLQLLQGRIAQVYIF